MADTDYIPMTKDIQNQWFKHAGVNRPKEKYVKEFLFAILRADRTT